MSTIVSSPPRAAVRVTLRGVATAEWIKLRSLRSAAWLLAGIAVSIVGIGTMPALGVAVGALPPIGGVDPAGGALDGLSAAQLLAGALGVVAVTSEYASRTITTTLAAVPRRLPLVGAKVGVVGVVVFLAALGAVLVAVLGAAALLAAGVLRCLQSARRSRGSSWGPRCSSPSPPCSGWGSGGSCAAPPALSPG